MYDAVHLFAKALHDLDSSQRIDIKPLSCDAVDTWPHGYSLINYMKIVSVCSFARLFSRGFYIRFFFLKIKPVLLSFAIKKVFGVLKKFATINIIISKRKISTSLHVKNMHNY